MHIRLMFVPPLSKATKFGQVQILLMAQSTEMSLSPTPPLWKPGKKYRCEIGMFPLEVLLKSEDKKGRVMRDGPLAIIIGISP